MSVSTEGLQLRSGSRWLSEWVELLSSMRFAISLLTVICIASVIGTVVKQHEPANNYVNQFGPFWADVFASASLFSVYSAWWFLLILAFLVVSTSLCIARTTPKIFADFKALVFFQLGLEPLEQREGIGGGPGKACQHLVAVQLAHLARGALDHHVAQRHLTVSANGHLHAIGRLAPHTNNGGSVK